MLKVWASGKVWAACVLFVLASCAHGRLARRRPRATAGAIVRRAHATHVVLVGRSIAGLAARAQSFLMSAHRPGSVLVHCVFVRSDPMDDFHDQVRATTSVAPHTSTKWRLVHDATPDTALVRSRRRWVSSFRAGSAGGGEGGIVVFAHACAPQDGWDAHCARWHEEEEEEDDHPRPFLDGTRDVLVAWPHASGTAHFPVVRVEGGKAIVDQRPFRSVDAAAPNVWHSCLVSPLWIAMREREVERFPLTDGVLAQTQACLDARIRVVVSDALSCIPASRLKVRGAPHGGGNVRTTLGRRVEDAVGLSTLDEEVGAAEMIAKYGSIDEAVLRVDAATHERDA